MSRAVWTGFLIVGLLAAAGCDESSPSTPTTPTTPSLPSISISPSSAKVGSPTVTISITGSNFANGDHHMTNWTTWIANRNEQVLETHFVDSSQITADIPADLLKEPVTAQIWVTTACDQCDNDPNKGPATFVVSP